MNVDARLELDCQLVQDARKYTIAVRHANSRHGMQDTRKNVFGLEVHLHFICLITLSFLNNFFKIVMKQIRVSNQNDTFIHCKVAHRAQVQ